MKIAVCEVCGRYVFLHCSDNMCMYCNSVIKDISDLSSDTGKKCIEECDKMLSESSFEKAVRFCDESIEKFPDSGILYWYRLLARNNCENETQILCSGKDIFRESDYINANEFSNESELKALNTLREVHKLIVERVIFEVRENEKREKQATNIIYIQENCQNKINEIRKKLQEKIGELDDIERRMKNAVVQRNAYISARKQIFIRYLRKIEEQRGKFQHMSEIDLEEAHKQKIELSRNLDVCNSEYEIIKSEDKDESYREYKRLSAKRDEVEKSINTIIAELNGLIVQMNDTIKAVEMIEDKYKKILGNCEKGNFISAHSLLGKSRVRQVIIPNCLSANKSNGSIRKTAPVSTVNLNKKTD